MRDMTRWPSPIPSWTGDAWVPQGTRSVVFAQDFAAPGDPALDATTQTPWWLRSILDTTLDPAGALRDWSTTTGAHRLSTAAATGSRRRMVGAKPVRLDLTHALYWTVGLGAGSGARRITMALDNREDSTGAAVGDADRGVRLSWDTGVDAAKIGYNNVAVGSEQIPKVIVAPSGTVTLALFVDTGHIGVWVGDQCVLLRRPVDLKVSASTQVVRPRIEIEALSATAATQDITTLEFAAFVGGPVLGLPLTPAPPAAGQVFVQDTMTTADGTLVTARAGETGATWTKHGASPDGDMTITAGKARTTSTVSTTLVASGAPPTANYAVEADLTFATVPTSINFRVAGRLTGTTRAYGYAFGFIAASGVWRLDRLGDTNTTLASVAASVSAGQTKRIGLRMAGSTIVGTVDGVDVLTATDTSYASGAVGLLANGASTTSAGLLMDNFTATTV